MTNPEQRKSRTGGAGDLHRQTLGVSVIRVPSYVWILAVLGVLPLRSGVPTDGLVAQWKLDGNGMDSSGNGYHGTLTGTVPTDDRFGNPGAALSFDGVDDHVWLADHAVDLQPALVSIAAW